MRSGVIADNGLTRVHDHRDETMTEIECAVYAKERLRRPISILTAEASRVSQLVFRVQDHAW